MKSSGKMRSIVFIIAILMLVAFAGCDRFTIETPAPTTGTPEPTPTPQPTPVPTPRVIVTVKGLLPGEAPAGLQDVFAEVNSRIEEQLCTRVELTWAAREDFAASVEKSLASGTAPDFFWSGPEDYASYASGGDVLPLDDLLGQFGPAIMEKFNAAALDGMRVGGKLVGLPCAGNAPQSGRGHVFTVREDLRLKYGLPALATIADLEAYFTAVRDNEPDAAPLCSVNAASIVMRQFGAEDFLAGTGGSIAYAVNADGTVACLPIQDAASYSGAVAKVREWYKAGYLPKDVVAVADAEERLVKGAAAAVEGGALRSAALQGSIVSGVPGAVLADLPVWGTGVKYLDGNEYGALCLSAASQAPERVVQFWNWIYADQSNYDLICYGIKGVHYTLSEGRIATVNDNYSGFPEWMFRNANFMRFPQGISEEYIASVRAWNDGAVASPIAGFVFDPSGVQEELAAVTAVYETYSPLLESGSSDPAALLAEFGDRLKAAGQDALLAEAQRQVNAYLGVAPPATSSPEISASVSPDASDGATEEPEVSAEPAA